MCRSGREEASREIHRGSGVDRICHRVDARVEGRGDRSCEVFFETSAPRSRHQFSAGTIPYDGHGVPQSFTTISAVVQRPNGRHRRWSGFLALPIGHTYWLACKLCRDTSKIWIFSDGYSRNVPAWFTDYFQRVSPVLEVTPGTNVEEDLEFYRVLNKATCQICHPLDGFVDFVKRQWVKEIKAQIDKVFK
ncbi:hypothetical protein DFH09DRAFT_1090133 [Mycena vulgaris]|nr:hypothetical protein DFH09DRAFT_1090133 [Mycena vulgaris]